MENAVLVAKVSCCGAEREKPGEEWKKEELAFMAVTADSPENAVWAAATPCMQISMTIENEAAMGKIPPGKKYLVYFVPCDD